jgi:hypothetical protein
MLYDEAAARSHLLYRHVAFKSVALELGSNSVHYSIVAYWWVKVAHENITLVRAVF